MITANELKTRGVKAIEEQLKESDRTGITVRGKVKYVAMTVEQYDRLREAEISLAYHEVMKEYKGGDYIAETAEEHIDRLWPEE